MNDSVLRENSDGFGSAFGSRRSMPAADPDQLIHFNGGRFLGPYPDVGPKKLVALPS